MKNAGKILLIFFFLICIALIASYVHNIATAKSTRPHNYELTHERHGGVTALCNDGMYSYSTSKSGTCATHEGVKIWY